MPLDQNFLLRLVEEFYANGWRVHPGSDRDIDLVVVDGVTGAPTISWDEDPGEFDFSHGINVTGNISVSGTVDGIDIATQDAKLVLLHDTIGLKDLTADQVDQLEAIGTTTISAAQWGFVGGADQAVKTTDTVQFGKLGVGIAPTADFETRIGTNFAVGKVTLADDASTPVEDLVGGDGVIGILEVFGSSGDAPARFFIRGGIQSVILLEDGLSQAAAADTDTKLCVFSDGDGTYTLKNRRGASRDISWRWQGRT